MVQAVTLDQVIDLAQQLSPLDQLRLIERIVPQIESRLEASSIKPLRSLYGLWQGVNISEQDIADARQEMWGNFGEREI